MPQVHQHLAVEAEGCEVAVAELQEVEEFVAAVKNPLCFQHSPTRLLHQHHLRHEREDLYQRVPRRAGGHSGRRTLGSRGDSSQSIGHRQTSRTTR